MSIREALGQSPRQQTFLPTKNDPLNIHLGGGLPVGDVNELYGMPEMFKTTFCAEQIGIALDLGGWAIVHDREGRLTSERFQLLGVDPEHERMIYMGNDPLALTIERSFQHAQDAVNLIRSNDAYKVTESLKQKKPAKKLMDRYRARFMSPKATAKKLVEILEAYPHQLCTEDRSLIFWVLDSATATPSLAEVMGGRVKNKDLPKTKDHFKFVNQLELAMRSQTGHAQTMGVSAAEWSSQFKRCTFIDDRVCVLMTAQMRTALTQTGQSFMKSAVPNANLYYARTRFHVSKMPQGEVYRGPGGNLVMADKKPTAVDQEFLVGKRIMMTVKKTVSGHEFSAPSFMIGTTGTDRPNTVWEYLHYKNLIAHQSGGRYAVIGHPELGPFTRQQFVGTEYEARLDDWAKIITDYVRSRVA